MELGWNVLANALLALGYTRERWDRDFHEIKTSDEDIFRLTADTRPTMRWNLHGSYEHGGPVDRPVQHQLQSEGLRR